MISPAQCRAARELLGWTQADLAACAGTTERDVRLFERGFRKVYVDLAGALVAGGIVFVPRGPGC